VIPVCHRQGSLSVGTGGEHRHGAIVQVIDFASAMMPFDACMTFFERILSTRLETGRAAKYRVTYFSSLEKM
jgi:hypothetical protein